MHGNPEQYFDFFTAHAQQLGAWRLPPPLEEFAVAPAEATPLKPKPKPKGGSGARQPDESVQVVTSASRADFLPFAERGEPVILRQFADVSSWSWEELVQSAKASEATGQHVSGDVLVSATGVVPDYCRGGPQGDSAHASRLESMTSKTLSLAEIFERVCGSSTGATGCGEGGEDGARSKSELPPLLCRFEKVYSYGRGWMLGDAALRAKARATWPAFLEPDDLHEEEAKDNDASKGGGGGLGALAGAANAEGGTLVSEVSGCGGRDGHKGSNSQVCWVGSAGCLTPLHYDMSDGLLAQVLGEKRVWLFPPDGVLPIRSQILLLPERLLRLHLLLLLYLLLLRSSTAGSAAAAQAS